MKKNLRKTIENRLGKFRGLTKEIPTQKNAISWKSHKIFWNKRKNWAAVQEPTTDGWQIKWMGKKKAVVLIIFSKIQKKWKPLEAPGIFGIRTIKMPLKKEVMLKKAYGPVVSNAVLRPRSLYFPQGNYFWMPKFKCNIGGKICRTKGQIG